MEQFAGPSREVTPQIREHSSSVWEGLRDQITQLHSVQGKSLGEVMSIIEREHGFVASLRQYKIKISEWHAKRAQKDKDTNFRVRGRDVAPDKIARAMKRQRLSDEEIISMPSIPTPSDISYDTTSAVDPESPYVQQAVAPSPAPTFSMSAKQVPDHSTSNTSEWQNQALFLVSPGYLPATPLPVVWHNPSTPLPSASFQTPPGMLQSPGSLWSTGPMDGIIEEGDAVELADDSDAWNTKYERLIELVRKTEEAEISNYMETMSEVNSLVYDLIAFDQLRSQVRIEEHSASITKCYVCRALEVLGTKDVAAKVESERILLEAIAISEGCFGEEHRGALHFRVKLFLLYDSWDCRIDEFCGVLLRILLVASRKAPSLEVHELLSSLLGLPEAAELTKCAWLQISSWGSFFGISSHRLSTLSIRDVTIRDSPRNMWEMILAVNDRVGVMTYGSRDALEPLLDSMLQQGADSADGPSYFWMATFIAALQEMEGTIYNSKLLIMNTVSKDLPRPGYIKSILEQFSKNSYGVEQSAVTEINVVETDSGNSSNPSLSRLQSRHDDVRKIKHWRLEELCLALAEVSLGELEKLDKVHIFRDLIKMVDLPKMYGLVCSAAQLGYSTLITKLGQYFENATFDGFSSFIDILNLDILNLDRHDAAWRFDEEPIVLAIEGGHYRSVEALLDAGADPDGVERSDIPPVEFAAESGHDDIVRLLIRRGADVSVASISVMQSVVGSSDQKLCDSILETFVGSGYILSMLYYLILVGKFERYERLDIVSAEIKDSLAMTRRYGVNPEDPLMLYTNLDEDERESLLNFLNEEDHSGKGLELILNALTGVHIEQQARSILKSALFDTDAVDEMLQPTETSDNPVLHTLVSRNAPNALSVFLDLRPNLGVLDSEGNTVLHIATRMNRVACATLLLSCKVDVNLENNDGETALQIALRKGHKKVSDEILMVLPMSLVVGGDGEVEE